MAPRLIVLGLCVLVPGLGLAQGNIDYVLSFSDPAGPVGTTASVSTILDSAAGEGLSAWSWGVCHDNTIVEVLMVEDGEILLTVNGGEPPSFDAPLIVPGLGWAVAVVVDFNGDSVLPPGAGYELHHATYQLLTVGSSPLSYCNTIGDPPVQTLLLDAEGNAITPMVYSGAIEVVDGPTPFTFEVGDRTVYYVPELASLEFEVRPSIAENPATPGFPFPSGTTAFSMGLAHDSGVISLSAIEPAPVLTELNDGEGPDFFGPNVNPAGGPGVTVGVVYDFLGLEVIWYTTPTEVIVLAYSVNEELLSTITPFSTTLWWSDDLGMPAVVNSVVVAAATQSVELVHGTIEFVPETDVEFVRGDCNDDGLSDIADGVFILNNLFVYGPPGDCFEACNVNADAVFDQSDAVYLFNYVFLGATPPPPPFPSCGSINNAFCGAFVSCP